MPCNYYGACLQISDASLKDGMIVERIVEVVVVGCDCDFTDTFITDRVFQCFPSSPHAVTYHAQLHSALNNSVSRLVAYLQEWASSGHGVSIPVQFIPLAVDSFCTAPSSTPVEHCPGTTPSTETSTTHRSMHNYYGSIQILRISCNFNNDV